MGGALIKEATDAGEPKSSGKPVHFKLKSYRLLKVLGAGSYGTLTLAKYLTTNTVMAMKITDISGDEDEHKESRIDSFLLELSVLKRIQHHPNLPHVYVAFHNETTCFLGMDFAAGGDLRYHLGHKIFTSEQVAYIMYSVGSALNYMHQHHVIHRDVKPENIILDKLGHPILIDFGISHMGDGESVLFSRKSSGTAQYLAPEVLTPSRRHSVHADFWSLGVIGFELLFRKRPFKRYCDKAMVYFVENHYTILWNRVSELSCPSGGDDTNEQASFSVDWEKLAECSESERVAARPYPEHDIKLCEDGSVPFTLLVSPPPVTSSGEVTSDECVDLLQGLLDVRIPNRLGTANRYETFKKHPFFSAITIAGSDSQMFPAPFIPDTSRVETHLKETFKGVTYTPQRTRFFNDAPIFTPQIQDKLNAFSYVSPELERGAFERGGSNSDPSTSHILMVQDEGNTTTTAAGNM